MTAQIRDLTYKLSSYTDENSNYCEVWRSDDVLSHTRLMKMFSCTNITVGNITLMLKNSE